MFGWTTRNTLRNICLDQLGSKKRICLEISLEMVHKTGSFSSKATESMGDKTKYFQIAWIPSNYCSKDETYSPVGFFNFVFWCFWRWRKHFPLHRSVRGRVHRLGKDGPVWHRLEENITYVSVIANRLTDLYVLSVPDICFYCYLCCFSAFFCMTLTL